MSESNIKPITIDHAERYGEIFAKAFSGEPWNDPWKTEDAVIHVRELLESKQAYGLEYVVDGEIAGLNLITEAEGFLPEFYERYGFSREKRVILMGREL